MSNSQKYLETNIIIGNWQAKRVLIDKLYNKQSSFKGEMNISLTSKKNVATKSGSCDDFIPFCLKERGMLTYNTQQYNFFQEYYLHFYKNRCNVLLSNQLPFFSINRTTRKQEIAHICNLDRYFGQIKFINKYSFSLTFNVKGPKKDYYLRLLYKR